MNSEEVAARIHCFLNKTDCPKHYTGFLYLKSVVAMLMQLETSAGYFTKILYLDAAKHFNTDVANLERCLRIVVDRWWEHNNCGGLFVTKPTLKRLLSEIAEQLFGDFLEERIEERRRERIREEEARLRFLLCQSTHSQAAVVVYSEHHVETPVSVY